MRLTIPLSLSANCSKTAERIEWLEGLEKSVTSLQRRWTLEIGHPYSSSAGWVAPVTLPDGMRAVFKICMPHMEGEQEIQGLRCWDGQGMVRILEADQEMGAILMERCDPGTDLSDLGETEQDLVMARLLKELWGARFPPNVFRPLAVLLDHWSCETMESAKQWADAGIVQEGLHVFQTLARETRVESLLVTDLHAGNVLRAERAPWLAIDPKPFLGDRAFDATQHLLNCPARMRSQPKETIQRFADLLELSQERVRLWMFARVAAEPRDEWDDANSLRLARMLTP